MDEITDAILVTKKTEKNGILKKIQETLLPSLKTTSNATNAYLMATYGKIETQENRLSEFIKDVDTLISNKAQAGQFCCSTEVPNELAGDFLKTIITKYRELGFTVIDLNESLDEIKRNYIFICWDIYKE